MGAGVNRSFTSLRYPDYLATDEAPAYIRFEPFEMDFGKFKNTAPTGASIISGLEDSVENSTFDKLKGNLIDKAQSVFVDKAKSLISGKLKIGDFEIDFDKEKDILSPKGSINLFLPEGIGSNIGLQYDGEASGVGLGRAAGNVFNDVMNGNNTSVSDAMSDVASAGISQLVNKIASNNTARVITGLGAGVVSNNVTFQLFKGVSYRSFSYQWTLTPKNEKESIDVKKICDTMLHYALPSRSVVEDAEAEGQKGIFHFYDIPAMWKIGYYYKDAIIPYHQQPKTYCVLTNVDVQYPNNQLYSDGAPLQVLLTLSFTEMEPMYRKGEQTGNNQESSYKPNDWADTDGNFTGP